MNQMELISSDPCTASDYIVAKESHPAQSQTDSIPHEVKSLKAKLPILRDRHLNSLAPKYDEATGVF